MANATSHKEKEWLVRMRLGKEDEFGGSGLKSLLKILHQFLSMDV